MKFLGKPFFHSYGYGADQPVSKVEEKIPRPVALTMPPEKIKEVLNQISRRQASAERRSRDSQRRSTHNKLKSSTSQSKRQSLKPSDQISKSSTLGLQNIGTLREEKRLSQQPQSRLPSLPKKVVVTRTISEEKNRINSSYLQRERFKRYLDSTKKVSWEVIEKLNKEELKGYTKEEFDPRSLLTPQTDEDRQILKNLGVVGIANSLPMPTIPAERFIGTGLAHGNYRGRSKSPMPANLKPLSELKKEMNQKKSSEKKANLSPIVPEGLPKSAGHSKHQSLFTAQRTIAKTLPSDNSVSKKRGSSNDKSRGKHLNIDSQLKRNDQLMEMLKKLERK